MARKRPVVNKPTPIPPPSVSQGEFVQQVNGLLAEVEKLLKSRREVDRLLESRVRLEARLLWLLQKGGTLPSTHAGEPADPTASSLDALRADLEKRFESAVNEKLGLEQEVRTLRATLKQVEQTFPQAPSTNPSNGFQVTELQSALVEFVLLRNRVITESSEMSFVPDRDTGVTGKSNIRFLDILRPNNVDRHLIAKFDDAERADQEWETIEQLRQLILSEDIILPEKYSHGDDGVIISPAARTQDCGAAKKFVAFVRANLRSAPQHCIKSIEPAFKLLCELYRIHPGKHADRIGNARLTWRTALPENWSDVRLGDAEKLYTACSLHRGESVVKWRPSSEFSSENGWTLPRSILNPIIRLPLLIGEATGSLLLSRIHGDLNLTNMMVAEYKDGPPEKVFVIDLADSERDRPAALDFARLEVALWTETFACLVPAKEKEGDWLIEPIALRDRLDGRLSKPLPDTSFSWLHDFGHLVNAVRRQAFLTLRPTETKTNKGHYILTDYFHCLYFTFLSLFRHDRIQKDGFQCSLLLLGASLTLQCLDDRIKYRPDARERCSRPWELNCQE